MQLGKWDVEANGQTYAVTVDRAENGKDMIRINGRVAAKPIGAEEDARAVTVAGWPYMLRRVNANAYDLEVDEASPELARARTIETANMVLAHGDAPIAAKRDSFYRFLPLIGYAALILGVVGLMYMLKGPSYDKVAFSRVKRVLSEMHEMKGSPFAVTYWFKNKRQLDQTEMNIASDKFDRWLQEKDLYRKVGDFEVIDSKIVDGAATPTAIVRFVLEGKEYKVRVPKDLPISWEE
jgi:hypothetical protein